MRDGNEIQVNSHVLDLVGMVFAMPQSKLANAVSSCFAGMTSALNALIAQSQ